MSRFFKKIINSIFSIIIGILLLIWAFIVIFINEWSSDLSNIAQSATIVTKNNPFTWTTHQLVAVEWKWHTNELLSDLYIKDWEYISLKRNVEIFAREEKKTNRMSRLYKNMDTFTQRFK